MNLSDNGSSFVPPFGLDYRKRGKYLYLGIFYFESIDTSIVGKNNSTKIIKHLYFYLFGENMILDKLDSFMSGSYSYAINLVYFNNECVKTI